MTSKSLSPVQIYTLSLCWWFSNFYIPSKFSQLSLTFTYSTLSGSPSTGVLKPGHVQHIQRLWQLLPFFFTTTTITQSPNHKLWHHSQVPLGHDPPNTITKLGVKCTLLFSQPPWCFQEYASAWGTAYIHLFTSLPPLYFPSSGQEKLHLTQIWSFFLFCLKHSGTSICPLRRSTNSSMWHKRPS